MCRIDCIAWMHSLHAQWRAPRHSHHRGGGICQAGRNIFGEGYQDVLSELLLAGNNYAHVPARRLVWLQAATPLLEVGFACPSANRVSVRLPSASQHLGAACRTWLMKACLRCKVTHQEGHVILHAHAQAMGVASVRSFSRLLPLLLEWVHAPDQDTRLAALKALHAVLALTWPRLPAHASLIWQHISREYESELAVERAASSGRQDAATDSCETGEGAGMHAADARRQEALAWLERVAQVLWWAGGEPFREHVHALQLTGDLQALLHAACKPP